ncbi:MAG TPA: integrase [Microbacterium sp.]|uniref:tyrosine-type recombinase/integrase n=1 Tax=unclassified Microbacterium TaxID=2609290 RepID=UPI000C62C814|nr:MULTISPECIES: tyrosine-type recombinase/integrase [unclassified Microbacterium]MBU18806.1 integrase [Microbacterium sp.]HBS08185.1 integrase [Microbacterium sp.]HBU43460.1 integrase [Microbacterium sp.]|tara:strand:- start:8235 stop:9170 length:936 start_codon:yes stop_codon:yes gene_type:complete
MSDLATYPTSNAERHGDLGGSWLMSLPSTNTQRAYRRDLVEWFAFLDARDLDALTVERRHLDWWRNWLTDTGSALSTVARKLAAISSFYRYALAENVIVANPAQLVTRPKVDPDHSATNGMTQQQAHDLLDAAREDDPRSLALVSLLLVTGARLAEVLNARVDDLQHDTGHRVLVIRRKGGMVAKLALPPLVVDALGTYLGQSAAEGTQLVTTDAASANPLIFTTRTGKAWAASEAFRTVQRLARRAGIEGSISPHSLRHTHGTLALDNGVTLHDLQDSMGHADPRTTRRYDRARRRLEKSSAYTLANVLS